MVSKDFLLRKVAISCLRQLCQRDAFEICEIARKFVLNTKPMGLIAVVGERGLECLLFKMLDIETNPYLIRDIHDTLNSLLCTSLTEKTLRQWLYLCKDIAVSSEDSSSGVKQAESNPRPKKPQSKKKEAFNEDEDDEEDPDDDLQSFQTSKTAEDPSKLGNYDPINNPQIKLKQITKIISPKWPNRVFSVELIRRIITMFASNLTSEFAKTDQTRLEKNLAHFDLNLANKLKHIENEDYLILFLQDLMRVACIAATSNCDPLKLAGLDLLNELIIQFSHVEEPNPEFKGHLILEQYQAQVSAALRPQFSVETSAHVTAKACQVCSMWISSGVARDLNDLRRVHQLLVSSLQKLSNTVPKTSVLPLTTNTTSNESLVYSELSLTVEKLAVLRAWAEVYIVAHKKSSSDKSGGLRKAMSLNESGLLGLVQPELSILSYHWSVALKDFAFLSLPSEYASQLPVEGGAFYHVDLVDSSKQIYKEHFTKILLAYSIWLNEINFDIEELPANQKLFQSNGISNNSPGLEQKEKLFFMLLGLSLEHLSNTTGLAQLSDETIENILESIDYLLRTQIAKTLILKKSIYLCVEILSILYK